MRALVLGRPLPAPSGPRDQLDPALRRDSAIGVVGRLAFKRMLKSIPHSPASSHNPIQAKRGAGTPLTGNKLRGLLNYK
jgi:hypothetical protein